MGGITKERNGFVFYRSFRDSAKVLPEEEQLPFLWAIADLALDNKEPNEEDFSAIGKALWRAIKPSIEKERRRFENGCKGAEFGKLGGAPSEKMKGNQNARKYPVQEDTNTQSSSFIPPTRKELSEYVKQSYQKINIDLFLEYYEECNWTINGNKMRDWKRAVSGWYHKPKRTKSKQTPKQTPKQTHYE